MSTNKKFDDIMREIIQAKNKSIMSEYEKIAEESENTPIGAIDENIIKAVIEYDKKEKIFICFLTSCYSFDYLRSIC